MYNFECNSYFFGKLKIAAAVIINNKYYCKEKNHVIVSFQNTLLIFPIIKVRYSRVIFIIKRRHCHLLRRNMIWDLSFYSPFDKQDVDC